MLNVCTYFYFSFLLSLSILSATAANSPGSIPNSGNGIGIFQQHDDAPLLWTYNIYKATDAF